MLKYRIEIEESGRKSLPVVKFDDNKFDLAGEFLLAEARNFGSEILEAVNEVCVNKKSSSEFAGNAFSLEISSDVTKIIDEISERVCEIKTEDLRNILEDYLQHI